MKTLWGRIKKMLGGRTQLLGTAERKGERFPRVKLDLDRFSRIPRGTAGLAIAVDTGRSEHGFDTLVIWLKRDEHAPFLSKGLLITWACSSSLRYLEPRVRKTRTAATTELRQHREERGMHYPHEHTATH